MEEKNNNNNNNIIKFPENTTLDETLQNLINLNEEDSFGLQSILALFALDDDKFNILAPAILSELENAMRNPNDQIAVAKMFEQMGIDVNNIQDTLEPIKQAFIEEMGDALTETKKNFLDQMLMTLYNISAKTNEVFERIIQIPVEKCDTRAKVPVYAHITDSGADLYALEDITVEAGETVLVKTGLKVAIPNGYEIQIRPKSGLSLKTKLRIANTPGTIDAGYRDEIGVIIENVEAPIKKIYTDEDGKITGIDKGKSYTIGAGQKFAQAVLMEVPKMNFQEVSSVLSYDGDRGGGFGSTGTK